MKSMCCTLRFTGWRWMSLMSDGYTLPSTVRSRMVFIAAAPERATRSSRRLTDTLIGSIPWPYTTAGMLSSARRRRESELPVRRPVSAMRTVSDMVIDFHQLLVPATAGNPVDSVPRQVNTAASHATAPPPRFRPSPPAHAVPPKYPRFTSSIRRLRSAFRDPLPERMSSVSVALSGSVSAHFRDRQATLGRSAAPRGRRRDVPPHRLVESHDHPPQFAASPDRVPGRRRWRGRRRATTTAPGSTASRTSGHAMSRWIVSPCGEPSGYCRAGRAGVRARSNASQEVLLQIRSGPVVRCLAALEPSLDRRHPVLALGSDGVRGSRAASAGVMRPRCQASSAARSNRNWLKAAASPKSVAQRGCDEQPVGARRRRRDRRRTIGSGGVGPIQDGRTCSATSDIVYVDRAASASAQTVQAGQPSIPLRKPTPLVCELGRHAASARTCRAIGGDPKDSGRHLDEQTRRRASARASTSTSLSASIS